MRSVSAQTEPLIDHPRGLLLTLCLFAFLRVSEIALNYMAGIGLTLTTARELAVGNGLDILQFCLLLLVLKEGAGIDVGRLFLERLPSLQEGLKWGSVGIGLSIPSFVHASSLPTYFGYEGYVTFVFLHVAHLTTAMPCIEETLFRGLCFASLLAVGRIRAYAISTFLFLLWHVKFIDLIVKGSTGLTLSHAASIVVFGLVGAYIYEKTRKLLLCMIFHGAGNAFVASTPFFMYFFEP